MFTGHCRHDNRADFGSTDDPDFKAAWRQAKFAMARRAAGMDFNDLLGIGLDVIAKERREDGSSLHDRALELRIKRRITREIIRWRKQGFAQVQDMDQAQ